MFWHAYKRMTKLAKICSRRLMMYNVDILRHSPISKCYPYVLLFWANPLSLKWELQGVGVEISSDEMGNLRPSYCMPSADFDGVNVTTKHFKHCIFPCRDFYCDTVAILVLSQCHLSFICRRQKKYGRSQFVHNFTRSSHQDEKNTASLPVIAVYTASLLDIS